MTNYDPNNIFAKILRGDIPSTPIYQDDHVLAIHDLYPRRRVHVLILAKGAFTDLDHCARVGDDATLAGLLRAVPKITDLLGVAQSGYRIITNMPGDGGQEIPHLHLHLLAGEPVGPLVG